MDETKSLAIYIASILLVLLLIGFILSPNRLSAENENEAHPDQPAATSSQQV